MKNQVGRKEAVCLSVDSHSSCSNSNRMMAAASVGYPLYLQTAHSNAGFNVCDYNLLHNYFLHMFENSEDNVAQKDKCKKCKKSSKKNDKTRAKMAVPISTLYSTVPEIQINKNASWFAMFASVRKTCLEHQSRAACLIQAAASSSWQDQDTDQDQSDSESGKANLPKIIGIGLKAVFDIIHVTERLHPEVCQKAVQSLLDILQGLQPEALRDEPAHILESMFELLLDLSTRAGEPISLNGNSEAGLHIRALACSCLLALSVAGGSASFLLKALSAILMSPRAYSSEGILLPSILATLQRSVYSVIIKRTEYPDYMTHGIPVSCLIDSFPLVLREGASNSNPTCYSMASDGFFLYIHTSSGLYKVGTGFSGTVRGHVYLHNPDLMTAGDGWLGYGNQTLFLKNNNSKILEIMVIDRDTLQCIKSRTIDKFAQPHLLLTDGEYLGILTPAKDESLSIKFFSVSSPMKVVADLPIKLTRKCLEAIGSSIIEENAGERTQIDFGIDDEISQVGIGREFALMLTTGGKLYYAGKSTAIGHKLPCASPGKWNEVVFSKSESSSTVINTFSIGHDGNHALLIGEDGSVFFTGTSKRGEDGDQSSKPRRPPKAKKPFKISRMDKLSIVSTACNSGTSCLVTKKGELYVFGKDTSSTDFNSGRVGDLANQTIVAVSIGKAHIVALNSEGEVFTFGINNKGQCGRDFPVTNVVREVPGDQEEYSDQEQEIDSDSGLPGYILCMPGKHTWKHDLCMICTVCIECTGYGASCVSANQPDRNPGATCGCGSGDSGCAECGCCRACAGEGLPADQEGPAGASGLAVGAAAGAGPALGAEDGGAVAASSAVNLIRLNLMASQQSRDFKAHRDYRARVRKRTAEKGAYVRRPRAGKFLDPFSGNAIVEKKGGAAGVNASNVQAPGGLGPSSGAVASSSNKEDSDKDLGKMSSLGPGRVLLPAECKITSVSCGLHHTLLLSSAGLVLAFGSNSWGQLGVGDLIPHGAPVPLHRLDEVVTKISAGAYHSVALTSSGRVFTWGNNSKGQLGRSPPPQDSKLSPAEIELWYSIPGVIPGLGSNYGKAVTWIYASLDQTLLKLDENLINTQNLKGTSIVANKDQIILLPTQKITPTSFSNLCISRTKKDLMSRSDGYCRSFSRLDQVEWGGRTVAMDPLYNSIWSYSSESDTIYCHNPIAVDVDLEDKQTILSPDLALPVKAGCLVSRSQAALNLLSCLDTITGAAPSGLTQQDEESSSIANLKSLTKEDFNVVNRFDSHGGGWGYSGHSIEAVRFSSDTDILVGGYGLFGGRGEYTGKIKLFDLGVEGGEHETDGELLAESDDVVYECGARQKFPILFEEPVPVVAGRWYVAWARVSGCSSDCGSSGQSTVTTEDQVQFNFKSSKRSNNGTDVNAGQIPQVLYRIMTHEPTGNYRKYSPVEPVHILSNKFGRPVTADSFQALLSLLSWAWSTFKASVSEMMETIPDQAALMDLNRLVFICRACLRLLVSFIHYIYPPLTPGPGKDGGQAPPGKPVTETQKLAECVFEVRCQLVNMLSDPLPNESKMKKGGQPVNLRHKAHSIAEQLVKDAHKTFVSCFHAFYPTGPLKWVSLCSLLNQQEIQNNYHILAATIDALCNPVIKLRSIFPIGVADTDKNPGKVESPTENISVTGSVLFLGDMSPSCKYPILTEVMNYQSHTEAVKFGSWTFEDVLSKLLNIVSEPVEHALKTGVVLRTSEDLVNKSCRLISTVISELSNTKNSQDTGLAQLTNRLSLQTPNRFARINSARTWNSGNGSPDAICFSVDKQGIMIAGAMIFGGGGNSEYELELLHNPPAKEREKDGGKGQGWTPDGGQGWTPLEVAQGSFSAEECSNDLFAVRFDKPVMISPHTKYALRLKNHGGTTSNGDGGLASVKGSDGTTFTFTSCSLSFNGTNQGRGQIPQIIYTSSTDEQAISSSTVNIAHVISHKSALSITVKVAERISSLLSLASQAIEGREYDILNSAPVFTVLLPHIMASISGLACSNPSAAVQVISLIQDLLPKVAQLNTELVKANPEYQLEGKQEQPTPHYAWVESDHPYKPAGIFNYRIVFPSSVKWMAIEFDPACCTAQPEDSLQVYIRNPFSQRPKNLTSPLVTSQVGTSVKSQKYSHVLTKFSGNKGWPSQSVVLPGNEVLFSLETASDYVKGDNKASNYGFKCLVAGYEVQDGTQEGLKSIEHELAYLGGLCASSLMNKCLKLPSNTEGIEEVNSFESTAQDLYNTFPTLLAKGFGIDEMPSIQQALTGDLPLVSQSCEKMFLKDFVQCATGTAGGRLASWLQPESHILPSKCSVSFKTDEMRCSWPTIVTVITRDQYGNIANAPNMKVEVKAIPIDELNSSVGPLKLNEALMPDGMTFGGHPPPNLDTKYEVTVREKMFYHAITVSKAYENYSFEELRWASPKLQRQSENMLVRPNGDGTYSANWTPSNIGWYKIHVSLDGCDLPGSHKVEILEDPQGKMPPSQNNQKIFPNNEIARLRQFIAKPSAGLRIRLHPTLQSEQIGIIPVDGIVSIVDELTNSDGIWVRLGSDVLNSYCSNSYSEGWCLQYNKHYDKQLMKPVVEQPSTKSKLILQKKKPEHINKPALKSFNPPQKTTPTKKGPGMYTVVKCGNSGHNIRCAPSLNAVPIGILSLGDNIMVYDVKDTPSGECWVKIERDSAEKYCFGMVDGDLWSLAVSNTDIQYLQSEAEIQEQRWPNILGNFKSKSNSFLSPFGISDDMKYVWGPGLPQLPPVPTTPFSPFDTSMTSSIAKSSDGSPSPSRRKSLPKPAGSSTSSSPRQSFQSLGSSSSKSGAPPTPPTPRSRSGTVERKSFFQKWFKSDDSTSTRGGSGVAGGSGSSSPARRSSPASTLAPSIEVPPATTSLTTAKKAFPINKDIPPELQGVSVKELVKVIGASRANGNGVTPPSTPGTPRKSRSVSPAGPVSQLAFSRSRSSSPMPIGIGKRLRGVNNASISVSGSCESIDEIGAQSLNSQTSMTSDTSDMISSLTRDMSILSTSPGVTRDVSLSSRKDGSMSPASLKFELVSSIGQTKSRTSSPGKTESIKEPANIQVSAISIDNPDPSKSIDKPSTSSSQGPATVITQPIAPTSTQAQPVTPELETHSKDIHSNEISTGPIIEAMSPSVAESIRSVFAAFIWHSGIVQDAMACASFLKFNPSVGKEGSSTTKDKDGKVDVEEKVKQRHSVEVLSTAYLNHFDKVLSTAYLNYFDGGGVVGATSKVTGGNANRNMNEQVVNQQHQQQLPIPELEETKSEYVPGLPQTLGQLVILWEGIVLTCLDTILSQSRLNQWNKEKSKSSSKSSKSRGDSSVLPLIGGDKVKEDRYHVSSTSSAWQNICSDTWTCDICAIPVEPPLTYHLKIAHPGCGDSAGGKGYDSSGQYRGGWTGNCGEGGSGGTSSGYIICEICRESYKKKARMNAENFSNSLTGDKAAKDREKKSMMIPLPSMLASLSYATANSPVGPLDCHMIMKANSLFLLDLASSTEEEHSRRTVDNELETVTELVPGDPGAFPFVPFRCLDILSMGSELKQLNDELLLEGRIQDAPDWEYPMRRSIPEEDLEEIKSSSVVTAPTTTATTSKIVPGTAAPSTSTPQPSTSSSGTSGEKPKESSSGGIMDYPSQIEPPVEFAGDGQTAADTCVRRRNKFHRSVSIGGSGAGSRSTSKETGGSKARTRNSSYEDYAVGGNADFLSHTSPAWKKLFEQGPISSKLFESPVISFLMRWNDLEALQMAMKLTLRKAVCRVYAMQAFNWLLRSVTQPVCIHDLLWCLISSLEKSVHSTSNNKKVVSFKEDKDGVETGGEGTTGGKDCEVGFEHPLSDLTLVGGAVKTLPSTFHILLQTISDLMLLLPLGSAVQQAAVSCFSIKFWPSDHAFLHQSQVFSTISKILSRSESDNLENIENTVLGVGLTNQAVKGNGVGAGVEHWNDMTSMADISVSSRPSMLPSLTDGSTETFWESGDEDRNKTKCVTIKCQPAIHPKSISIHVDNGRDIGNKVGTLVFKSGKSADDLSIVKTMEVDSKFAGWLTCFLADSDNHLLAVEIKGPDNTVRLRQIKLIGKANDFPSPYLPNRADSQRIQQANCETETLRVFRLITGQVFGKLLEADVEKNATVNNLDNVDGNDLKEHVVGILFSRSKLSHLQKQVCSHIVNAIAKEASCLRDDWELSLMQNVGGASAVIGSAAVAGSSAAAVAAGAAVTDQVGSAKASDTYCFEMLSMVLALSGSTVGSHYLSNQYSLIKDMLSFLHTGTARVQRAVVAVLRRILPLVPPMRFANILNISNLPPKDFTILNTASHSSQKSGDSGSAANSLPRFDPDTVGVLDIFLGCIAKSLSIQVKKKSHTGRSVSTVSLASCIHPRDNLGPRWWLRGTIHKKIAEEIITLIKEMTESKVSEEWTDVSKSAIAEAVLNLTKLDDVRRQPDEGLRCPTVWLAGAALCVLHADHVEGLSSGEWGGGSGQDRPVCDNHDDGETLAIILCDTCGNLCSDCDRFLHLHRKTRHHGRQVFKEEEEAMKVNLHEGCGRAKLFWLTAAADAATLKGMIEFKDEGNKKGSSGGFVEAVCRYCGGSSCAAMPVLHGVCTQSDCQEYSRIACSKHLSCGHPCGGIAGEIDCLPCLKGCDASEANNIKQDGDDMCMICFTEPLSPIPCIKLDCNHVFHFSCVRGVLNARWFGPRITFGFTQCPICKAEINHSSLTDLLQPIRTLYEDVKKKALMRLEYEGLSRCEALSTEGARWFNNPTGFALYRYAYYVCFKCNKAYFGGEARCDQEAAAGDVFNPEELVCGGCSDVSQAQMCPKHGTDYLEYKCRYCCSVAVFFCFGTTHFCNACHDDFQRVVNIPKTELPQCPVAPKAVSVDGEECPLHVKHPATGEEFALGCGICRNAHTF